MRQLHRVECEWLLILSGIGSLYARSMSTNLRLFTKAIYGMDHVVRLANPTDWTRPSPCDDWTARHVLGHVNAIQRYQESLIRGTEVSMNPMVDPDRHAGDDPAATWAATRDAILIALDEPGGLTTASLQRTICDRL